MPNIKSNVKYLRKSNKRKEKNASVKSRLKTLMKEIDTLVEKKDPIEKISAVLNSLYKYLDKAAGKNIIKKNKAARKKSQYAKKVYPFGKANNKNDVKDEVKVESKPQNNTEEQSAAPSTS